MIIELDVEIIGYCALPDLSQVQDDISLSTPLESGGTSELVSSTCPNLFYCFIVIQTVITLL